jgi:hypothetical protein
VDPERASGLHRQSGEYQHHRQCGKKDQSAFLTGFRGEGGEVPRPAVFPT